MIRNSVSKSPLPVGHSPFDVCSSQIPFSNKFSHLDLADASASEVSDGLRSAGILSPLSPEARMPQSPKYRPPTQPKHKRQHCSTKSVNLLSVLPIKVSVSPTPRV